MCETGEDSSFTPPQNSIQNCFQLGNIAHPHTSLSIPIIQALSLNPIIDQGGFIWEHVILPQSSLESLPISTSSSTQVANVLALALSI